MGVTAAPTLNSTSANCSLLTKASCRFRSDAIIGDAVIVWMSWMSPVCARQANTVDWRYMMQTKKGGGGGARFKAAHWRALFVLFFVIQTKVKRYKNLCS